QDGDRVRAPEHAGRALQGAERVRAARHQSHQAGKPPDSWTAVGISVLRRGRRAARRPGLRARADASRRVREVDESAWQLSRRREEDGAVKLTGQNAKLKN